MKNIKINEIKTDRVLSPTSINLADYVINPYRGCAFGCDYCYTMNNKNMLSRKQEWGKFVDVKVNAVEVLKRELDTVTEKPNRVLLGSITEICQPVEQKYQLIRRILEILNKERIPCIILTKSIYIKDYMDLLTYSSDNIIYVTYNNKNIKELFELNTPSYKQRLEIMNLILDHHIKLTVYISPYFPYLSDYKLLVKDLMSLKNQNFHLYFESYNVKMGNWQKIKQKLNRNMLESYRTLFSSQRHYEEYWDNLKKDILEYNKEFQYKIKFFIYPYDDYYKNDL